MALSFGIQLSGNEWAKPSPLFAFYPSTNACDQPFKVGDLDDLNTSTLLDTCELLAQGSPQLSKTLMDDLYRFYTLSPSHKGTVKISLYNKAKRGNKQRLSSQGQLNFAQKTLQTDKIGKRPRALERRKAVLKGQETQYFSRYRFPELTQKKQPSTPKAEKEDQPMPAYMLPLNHLRDIIIALTHHGNSLLTNTKALTGLDAIQLSQQKTRVKQLLDQWILLADEVLASQVRPNN